MQIPDLGHNALQTLLFCRQICYFILFSYKDQPLCQHAVWHDFSHTKTRFEGLKLLDFPLFAKANFKNFYIFSLASDSRWLQSWALKCMSTRAPGSRATWHLTDFRNFASLKGLPQNLKGQTGFCFGFFRGKIDHPPGFSWFSPRKNCFKIGKMYEALTAIVMVFNKLLLGFAH